MSNITEVEIRTIKNPKTSIVGSGTCLIGGMVKVSFTVIKGQKGLFVGLPQRSYQDKQTGETKYAKEVSLPSQDLYNELQKTVLEAFQTIESVPVGETDQTKGSDGIPF